MRRGEENTRMVLATREKGVMDRHEITHVLSDKHSSGIACPAQQLFVRLLPQGGVLSAPPFGNRQYIVPSLAQLLSNDGREMLVEEQLHAVSVVL